MPYADEHDAISGMADVLDQAADAVSQGLGSDPSIRSEALGDFTVDGQSLTDAYQGQDVSQSGMGIGPGNIGAEGSALIGDTVTDADVGPGLETFGSSRRGEGQRSPMGGGPSTDTMPESIYGGGSGTAPDVTDLGERPSLGQLQAALESGATPAVGDPTMGGGPSDLINLMGEEEVAEEVSPGEEVARFLSDFDRGMSASPAGMISQAEDQESLLTDPQVQASVDAGIPGSLRNRNIQSQMGGGPSDLHEAPSGSWDYEAGRINEPVPKSSMERLYESITNLGGSAMGAGGPDVPGVLRHDAGYDVVRSPHSTAMGTPNQAYLASQAGADIPGVTSFEGTPVDQAVVSGGAVAPPVQDIAPKYSGQTVTVETHNQMYPNQKTFATMAGVSSVLSTIDGSHAGWIDAVNKDMVARGIELSHTVDGKSPNGIAFGQPGSNLSGKHASGDWKEYSALFDPETGLDSNGVPMPGTAGAPVEEITVTESLPMSRQDRLIAEGKLPDLRFLPDDIKNLTPELRARMERVVNEWRRSQQQGAEDPYANLGYPDYASGNIPDNIRQAATVGDDTRGDNPVDIIRSTYTWAASLPNSVLFNAARYPDYLRLLIEYDAAGKDLPLTVPTWILEGTARPAEDNEETPSYATQQQLSWATPAWMT